MVLALEEREQCPYHQDEGKMRPDQWLGF